MACCADSRGLGKPPGRHHGTAAVDGDDHVIFDKSTGALYYDEDGHDHVFPTVPFALLTHLTGTLTHADFVVVD